MSRGDPGELGDVRRGLRRALAAERPGPPLRTDALAGHGRPGAAPAASRARGQGLRGRAASAGTAAALPARARDHVRGPLGGPSRLRGRARRVPAGARGAGRDDPNLRGLGVVDLLHARDRGIRRRDSRDGGRTRDRGGPDGLRARAARRGDGVVLGVAAAGVLERGRAPGSGPRAGRAPRRAPANHERPRRAELSGGLGRLQGRTAGRSRTGIGPASAIRPAPAPRPPSRSSRWPLRAGCRSPGSRRGSGRRRRRWPCPRRPR